MLLSKYRYLTQSFLPTFKQLHGGPQRNFSFQTLTKNMEARTKLSKKLKALNKKATMQSLPIHQRIFVTIKDHKKKTLFFCLVAGLIIHYEYYLKIIKYFKTMEPFQLKLRRWFLGEDRFIPDSIKELSLAEEGLKLRPETITVLSELFTKTDKEFAYGITRKFVKKVYSSTGYFQNKKDKETFYNEGPYRRRLNQRVNGMNLKEFLMFFEKVFKKLQKANSNFSEDDLLRMVMSNWDVSKQKALEWEQKLLSIRGELRKAGTVFEEDKRKIIMRKLKESPDIPLEELDRELAKYGFYGLGLKDKLLALEYQLMYWDVTKSYYVRRLETEVIPAKTMKIQTKIKDLESTIHNKKEDLERFKVQFNEIFKRKRREGEGEGEGEEGAEGETKNE